jgi:tryptophan synthase alpha chain
VKAATDLPVAVGFGVRDAASAAAIAQSADAVVVGTALVEIVRQQAEAGQTGQILAQAVGAKARDLILAVRSARLDA